MFKNIFSFEGRIRRTEYGISYLIYLLLSFGIDWILESNVENESLQAVLLVVMYFPMLWFLFAQGAKRCHDRGNSGWYQIIPFYFLWMLFGDGNFGPNEYGDNPKGLGNFDEIDALGEHLV